MRNSKIPPNRRLTAAEVRELLLRAVGGVVHAVTFVLSREWLSALL